jgi:hypothetical protein
VTLYQAGTGYGSDATSLGTATTSSPGYFTITYTPPSPAAMLYVVALGGNAGSGTNSAIGLMGIAGLSNALPGSIKINEFTTVAGAWALAQFTDSTGQTIGAPATNAAGFTNAANQAQANLADISTGGPAAFWTTYGINAGTCSDSPPVNCDGLERMDTSPISSHHASKVPAHHRRPVLPCSAIPAAALPRWGLRTIWPPIPA